ncbi:MAG: hypothetical protein FJ144_10340 [Deltaproteobacteria bacterium]|nr:hypothetical protein [Deltaproteobacteria bacterium]
MADDTFLDERREALEEQFFQKQNRALLDKLREESRAGSERSALAAASGISDEQTLDRLRAHGLHAETVAALTLFPLVAIAWADGRLEEKERAAIAAAAEKQGIGRGSSAHALLSAWVTDAPSRELEDAWVAYVRARAGALDPSARAVFAKDVLGHARAIAEAAGGILGVGSVSKSEREALARLERAFA